jgi:hypothetical protein
MRVRYIRWIVGAGGLVAWPAHAQQLEVAFTTGASSVPVAGWVGVAIAAMLGVLAHRKLRGHARTLGVMLAIACGTGALAWQGAEMRSAHAAQPPVSVNLQSSPAVVSLDPTNPFYELRNVVGETIRIVSIQLVNAPGYTLVTAPSLPCITPQVLPPGQICTVQVTLAPI